MVYCVLHYQLVVRIGRCALIPILILENLEGFSDDKIPGHPVLLGSCVQVLTLDDRVQYRHELEEGLRNSIPKQGHVDRHSFAVSLSRLGLDINLQRVRLVYRGLAKGWVGLVGYCRLRSLIIPIFFW